MSAAPLWTAGEAARATGGTSTVEWACTGIQADSRQVKSGDMFIALEGPRFDGHDFVAEACRGGAAAALVARRPRGVPEDAPLLMVDDTRDALARLAAAARQRSRARIIAVTGSVGKTGVKETLKLVLSEQAPTFASPASFNNHWGVPLSLAALPRNARYGVFELGMNHPGEIAPLTRLARPDIGVITTVEAVHTEFLHSLHAIVVAKAELFEGMGPDGTAVLNKDNPFYQQLAAAARANGVQGIISFGEHPHAAVRLMEAAVGAESSAVTVAVEGETIECRIGAPGRHWVTLGLAVLAAALAAGADVARAAASLAHARPLPGRGERHRIPLEGGAFTLIDESYNANPASMRAAIDILGATPGERRIAVLGDMLELGPEAPKLHASLAPALTGAGVDLLFTVGPNMAHLRDAVPAQMRARHAAQARDIVSDVASEVTAGDAVMVKGSLGSAMGPVVDALRACGQAPRAVGAV